MPSWFGHMTTARLHAHMLSTPPPRPKAPLAAHTGHNFEAHYDPLLPTSSTRSAVGPPPTVMRCQERTQAAFEAWRFHDTHDQFGRPMRAQARRMGGYKLFVFHRRQGNSHRHYWQGHGQQGVWAQLRAVRGLAEGSSSNVLSNLTSLGTQPFYLALHDWLTSFEGVMQ